MSGQALGGAQIAQGRERTARVGMIPQLEKRSWVPASLWRCSSHIRLGRSGVYGALTAIAPRSTAPTREHADMGTPSRSPSRTGTSPSTAPAATGSAAIKAISGSAGNGSGSRPATGMNKSNSELPAPRVSSIPAAQPA